MTRLFDSSMIRCVNHGLLPKEAFSKAQRRTIKHQPGKPHKKRYCLDCFQHMNMERNQQVAPSGPPHALLHTQPVHVAVAETKIKSLLLVQLPPELCAIVLAMLPPVFDCCNINNAWGVCLDMVPRA